MSFTLHFTELKTDNKFSFVSLCVDVIEMARNYEARVVERQAYLRLNEAFEKITESNEEIESESRFGKLILLKFMLHLRQAKKDNFVEASFLEKTFKTSATSIFECCGMRTALELHQTPERNCNHCRRHGKFIDPSQISGPGFSFQDLFSQGERSYFSVKELLEFKLCLITYATSPSHSQFLDSFMKEIF